MKVRAIVTLAGTEVTYDTGDIFEVTTEVANRLIEAGFVEAVEEERAVAPQGEKRTRRVKSSS